MQQPKIPIKRTVSTNDIFFFCGCCIIFASVADGFFLQYHPSILSRREVIGSTKNSNNNNIPRNCFKLNRWKYSSIQKEAPSNLHSRLFSSLLFPHDEFHWDEEEENYEDLDNNFEIQLESLLQISDGHDNHGEVVDDTDDSYYERLFLEQQNLSMKAKFTPLQSDDDDDQEYDILTKNNKIKGTKNDELEQFSVLNSSSQLTYDEIVSLRHEWREKIDQMRNEATEMRKIVRHKQRQLKMKEYASFLALRALRSQSMIRTEHKSSMMGVSGGGDGTSVARPLSESLPISSMLKTYNKDTIEKMDSPAIRLEQKLYGKRFKMAQEVFLRLLEVLDEMKRETKRVASEMITNRVEEELAVISGRQSTSINFTQSDMEQRPVASNKGCNKNKHLEDIMTMNKNHHLRLRRVVQLSLNGYKENRIKLSEVETDDLRSILRIRGNLKRRGRMPMERNKVLKCLEESFSLPLF